MEIEPTEGIKSFDVEYDVTGLVETIKARSTGCGCVEEAMGKFIHNAHARKCSMPLCKGYGYSADDKQYNCGADGNLCVELSQVWQAHWALVASQAVKGVADIVEEGIFKVHKYRESYTAKDNKQ